MADKPIFIHSLFRTGSTYIWNKFRQNKKYYCYYEPFHQELANIDYEKPEIWGHGKQTTQTMRHPDLDENYLQEYKKLLKPGLKGVPFFKKAFSFDNFCSADDNPDQKAYIDNLIKAAGDRVPVLQFNRSALRIAWFKKHYTQVLHIYLARNPRDQFHSNMDMYQVNRLESFLAMDLIVPSVNTGRDFFKELRQRIPLFEYHSDRFEDEMFIYSSLIPNYTTAEKYFIFYFTWFMSLFENGLNADMLLNIDLLSTSTHYREWFHKELQNRGVSGVDFSDAQIRQYRDTVIEKETMSEIEETVQSMALKRYTEKQIESFVGNIGPDNCRAYGIEPANLLKLKKKEIPGTDIDREMLGKYKLVFLNFANELVRWRKEARKAAEESAGKDRRLAEQGTLLKQKEQELEQTGRQLILEKQQLAQEVQRLAEKDRVIKEMEQRLTQADSMLKDKEQELGQKGLLIAQVNDRFQEQEKELQSMRKKLARQEQESAQKVQESKRRDMVLKDTRQELEKKDILLAERSRELQEKARQLAARDARLTQVLNSKSFRLGRFIMSPFFLIRKLFKR